MRISKALENGVLDSKQVNLLHGSFRVCANQLFNKLDRQENYFYLSGLLIGSELQELAQKSEASITLISNDSLMSLYLQALKLLLPNKNIQSEKPEAQLEMFFLVSLF